MSTRPITQVPQVSVTAPLHSGSKAGGPARAVPQHANLSILPHAAINSESGVRDGLAFQTKSLTLRQQATPRASANAQRQGGPRQGGQGKGAPDIERKAGKAAIRNSDLDPVLHMDSVEQTLDMLRDDSSRGGRQEVESILNERHQPMARWRVLHDALAGVENLNLSNYKRTVLREAIGDMMAHVVARDSGVRAALHEPNVAGWPGEGSTSRSVRELRFLITGKGSIDTPLTPLATLKAIISQVGTDHCEKAIAMLCAQMVSGL